jgi:hypothetical protein
MICETKHPSSKKKKSNEIKKVMASEIFKKMLIYFVWCNWLVVLLKRLGVSTRVKKQDVTNREKVSREKSLKSWY